MSNEVVKYTGDYPHWFLPFLPYIVEYNIEEYEGDVNVLLGVTLRIPKHMYDWDGVDVEALKACGISYLQIEKKGVQKKENLFDLAPATFDFTHWEIEMSFKNTILVNEKEGNLVDWKHE